MPSAPSEEATDEQSQEGGLARRAHNEDVATGGGRPEDNEEELRRSCDPSGDGKAPADVRASVAEPPRCARCGRAGVVEIGGEEAGGADNAPGCNACGLPGGQGARRER